MYLSKPKITPDHTDKQLVQKVTVKLHRGKGNTTTTMADHASLRHPVTQQFVARFQNQQSTGTPAPVTRKKG